MESGFEFRDYVIINVHTNMDKTFCNAVHETFESAQGPLACETTRRYPEVCRMRLVSPTQGG